LDSASFPAPFDCVLIHGAGGNRALWNDVLPALEGGRAAYALDLPGHPTGDISCRTVDEYAQAVHGFLTEHRIKPVLCGHSMGGAIAMTVAMGHPESVSGLALVSTGAKLGVLPEVLKGLEGDPLPTIERTITPMSFHRIDMAVARKARAALSLSNPAIFLNDYKACAAFDARDRLKTVTAPTIIVCGDDDRMTPPRWSQFLHDGIASSKQPVIVSEAGHMLPLEKPAECGRLLQAFLAELSR